MKKTFLIIALAVAGLTVKAQDRQETQDKQQQEQGMQKDIPSNVTSAFSEKFPDVSQNDVDWKREGKGEHFEAEFSKGEAEYTATFNNKGEWVSTEVEGMPGAELPEEVNQGLKNSEYGTWEIDEVESIETPGETLYKVEVESGMKNKELYLNQEGNMVQKEQFEQSKPGKEKKKKSGMDKSKNKESKQSY